MPAQIGLSTITATIASGAALSSAVYLGANFLVGIYIPSNWTSANVTFQASPDGGTTWGELYSYLGAEITFVAAPSQFLAVDPTLWKGARSLIVRSGTAATPVNQSNTVNLTLVLSL